MKETAPLFIKKDAVRLQCILNIRAWFAVRSLMLYWSSKKVKTHQCRLSALPRNSYSRHLMCREKISDINFLHFTAHAKTTLRIELIFIQKKTVVASKIALSTCWFYHDMKRCRTVVHLQWFSTSSLCMLEFSLQSMPEKAEETVPFYLYNPRWSGVFIPMSQQYF